MSTDPLEYIELETPEGTDHCTATVIWLHGLGADGHDFEPIVPELGLPPSPSIRFLFPHAPTRAVTVNGGAEMRAWYDVDPAAGLNDGTADIEASAAQVTALIEREIERGVPADRIVLAGFSQGGVIALHLGLRYGARLAGIMALSTYVHDPEHLSDAVSFQNLDVPILMCHGLMDGAIPITRAITSRETLIGLNYPVEWYEYTMGHNVCPEEIMDISRWLQRVLK